jgi:Kef-type K+ transport system membrane component KefB
MSVRMAPIANAKRLPCAHHAAKESVRVSSFLQLLLVLTVIVVVAKVAGTLSQRIGQPSVFGELLAGLLLGPTALNLLHAFPSAHELELVLSDLAELGVILLMFLAGLETDLKAMRKVGLAAFVGALGGVLLPFLGGIAISLPFGFPLQECIFIGTVLTATSVSISAQTLIELGQMRSKEGTTIMGAAVIDDVMGIIVLSLVVALTTAQGAAAAASPFAAIAIIIVRMVAFFVVAVLLGRYVGPVLKWVGKNLKSAESQVAIALGLIFTYAWAAEYLGGVAAITGSYILGVLIAQTDLGHHIEEKLRIPTYGLFVPVFFIHIGLQADARQLIGPDFTVTLLIVAVAILAKLLGAGAGVLAAGFKLPEAVRVGIGMVSRGEVALIVTSVGLRAGVIEERVFSIMVIMTLATTLVTPPLLRLAFPREQAVAHQG